MLKKIFNFFGYSFSKRHKSSDIYEIIKLRLENNPAMILVDIGANYGNFSINIVNFFEKVFFIEPNISLIKTLKKKFKNVKNVYFFSFGTNNKNKFSILNITNDTSKSLSSIKEQSKELDKNFRNTKVIKKIKIQLKRLDSFFDEIKIKNESIFLKIDTQGNDYETLCGIGENIKNIKYIYVELSCINLYKSSSNHWKILNFLKINNFEPVYFLPISRNKSGALIEYDGFFEKKLKN